MKLITGVFLIFGFSQIAFGESDICGSEFDQSIPIIEVIDFDSRRVEFKAIDDSSGIFAVSVRYETVDGQRVERVMKTVENEADFSSLAFLPNLVGSQPLYSGLEKEQTYDINNVNVVDGITI